MGSELATDVVALYVDPRGPYPGLVREWYDETRNAEMYAGPHPVVAHPPCGPWGRLRQFCTKQNACDALHAVFVVREFGGVLEHPAGSKIWEACGLPLPFANEDEWGGFTLEVRQCSWGHRAEKLTWVYCVGIDRAFAVSGIKTGGEPTHVISTSRRKHNPLPELTVKWERAITPPEFAAWLIELARSARGK